MSNFLYLLDLAGTAVFAVSGALAARGRRMDLFGVVVLAVVTGVGGGTIRDLVLGLVPVFWIRDPAFILVAAVTGGLTVIWAGRWPFPRGALKTADAIGLGLFSVIGAEVALRNGAGWIIAGAMGVTTGAAGGVIRDVLAKRVPLVLRTEIYATAALAGALAYVGAREVGMAAAPAMVIGGSLACALRLAALHLGWSLPVLAAAPPKS